MSQAVISSPTNEEKLGLWHIHFNPKNKEWERADSSPRQRLEPTEQQAGTSTNPIQVAINGNCKKLQTVASTLYNHILRIKEIKVDSSDNILLKNGYQILYVPHDNSLLSDECSAVFSLGRRGTEKQQQAADLLARLMYEAHEQGLYVHWTAHSHGAWVLNEAMRQLLERNIDLEKKQRIFMRDATSSLLFADRARHALNMYAEDENWEYTTAGISQIAGGLQFGVAPLLCLSDKIRYRTNHWLVKSYFAIDFIFNTITKSSFYLILAFFIGIHIAIGAVIISITYCSMPGSQNGYYDNPGHRFGSWLDRVFRKNRAGQPQ